MKKNKVLRANASSYTYINFWGTSKYLTISEIICFKMQFKVLQVTGFTLFLNHKM